MQSDQAANALTEDQVLNFLVNTLDEEIDSEDIWDVLVGATADEDSVTHLCEVSEQSPPRQHDSSPSPHEVRARRARTSR